MTKGWDYFKWLKSWILTKPIKVNVRKNPLSRTFYTHNPSKSI